MSEVSSDKYFTVIPDIIFGIFVADPSYDNPEYFEQYEDEVLASEKARETLEAELGQELELYDIAPGASFPAFLLEFPVETATATSVLLFLAGKKIEDNLEAWSKIASRIRKLFDRRVYVSRSAAAVLAVSEVMDTIGAPIRSVELISLNADEDLGGQDLPVMRERIEPDYPVIHTSRLIYRFKIIADDRAFLCSVQGRVVTVQEE